MNNNIIGIINIKSIFTIIYINILLIIVCIYSIVFYYTTTYSSHVSIFTMHTVAPRRCNKISKWLFCSLDPNGLEQGLHQHNSRGWMTGVFKEHWILPYGENAAPSYLFAEKSLKRGGCCKVLWSSTSWFYAIFWCVFVKDLPTCLEEKLKQLGTRRSFNQTFKHHQMSGVSLALPVSWTGTKLAQSFRIPKK